MGEAGSEKLLLTRVTDENGFELEHANNEVKNYHLKSGAPQVFYAELMAPFKVSLKLTANAIQ